MEEKVETPAEQQVETKNETDISTAELIISYVLLALVMVLIVPIAFVLMTLFAVIWVIVITCQCLFGGIANIFKKLF